MDVRQIVMGDAPAVQAIYAPYVTDTIISFEEVPPDIMEVERRIAAILPKYPYLVAEEDGRIVGYAYASEHRTRSAYRTSIDVTVYVAPGAQRSGVARCLYSCLLPAAASLGYHAVFAGIALPNDASVGLHEAMGFEPVGIYREVGRKFDAWHDVGWWQRLLEQCGRARTPLKQFAHIGTAFIAESNAIWVAKNQLKRYEISRALLSLPTLEPLH